MVQKENIYLSVWNMCVRVLMFQMNLFNYKDTMIFESFFFCVLIFFILQFSLFYRKIISQNLNLLFLWGTY